MSFVDTGQMGPSDGLPNLCFSPKQIKNLVGKLCVISQKGHVTSWHPRAKVDDFAPIIVNMYKTLHVQESERVARKTAAG